MKTERLKRKQQDEKGNWINNTRSYAFLLIVLLFSLLCLFFLSFDIGRFSGVTTEQVFKILVNQLFDGAFKQDWAASAEVVVINYRCPRIMAAILVGAALPMAGASYQAIFANPMASPDTLGVSNGAAVGAVIAILAGLSSFMVEVSAFFVGCAAVATVYFLSLALSRGKSLTIFLILIGMVISSTLAAVLSLLKYLCDTENQLPAITYWLLGSFNSITWQDTRLYFIFFVIGSIPLLLLRWRMNLLSLSDMEAKSLGENTNILRSITILSATLLTAASIAITGGIGWVGLIIPHIARIVVGQDFKKVLPTSALMGSIFLLAMDNISRAALAIEIPIGVLTSIIGAPVFFFILVRFRRNMLSEN